MTPSNDFASAAMLRLIQLGLRQQGFFVPAIRPPSVPEGEALLRISVTLQHDEAMLENLANALLKCMEF